MSSIPTTNLPFFAPVIQSNSQSKERLAKLGRMAEKYWNLAGLHGRAVILEIRGKEVRVAHTLGTKLKDNEPKVIAKKISIIAVKVAACALVFPLVLLWIKAAYRNLNNFKVAPMPISKDPNASAQASAKAPQQAPAPNTPAPAPVKAPQQAPAPAAPKTAVVTNPVPAPAASAPVKTSLPAPVVASAQPAPAKPTPASVQAPAPVASIPATTPSPAPVVASAQPAPAKPTSAPVQAPAPVANIPATTPSPAPAPAVAAATKLNEVATTTALASAAVTASTEDKDTAPSTPAADGKKTPPPVTHPKPKKSASPVPADAATESTSKSDDIERKHSKRKSVTFKPGEGPEADQPSATPSTPPQAQLAAIMTGGLGTSTNSLLTTTPTTPHPVTPKTPAASHAPNSKLSYDQLLKFAEEAEANIATKPEQKAVAAYYYAKLAMKAANDPAYAEKIDQQKIQEAQARALLYVNEYYGQNFSKKLTAYRYVETHRTLTPEEAARKLKNEEARVRNDQSTREPKNRAIVHVDPIILQDVVSSTGKFSRDYHIGSWKKPVESGSDASIVKTQHAIAEEIDIGGTLVEAYAIVDGVAGPANFAQGKFVETLKAQLGAGPLTEAGITNALRQTPVAINDQWKKANRSDTSQASLIIALVVPHADDKKKHTIWVANAGDSRAVVLHNETRTLGMRNQVKATQLSIESVVKSEEDRLFARFKRHAGAETIPATPVTGLGGAKGVVPLPGVTKYDVTQGHGISLVLGTNAVWKTLASKDLRDNGHLKKDHSPERILQAAAVDSDATVLTVDLSKH